ncbi:hypothetical protein [Pseudactinotalea sp. Z1748]|uniref:hypothetical protein n=1 Tax=Pseudactinotalea sp. Z1748 TaxID=3413027 RepID=UPI003C7D62C2
MVCRAVRLSVLASAVLDLAVLDLDLAGFRDVRFAVVCGSAGRARTTGRRVGVVVTGASPVL